MVEVEGAAEATSPSLTRLPICHSEHHWALHNELLFDPGQPRYRGIISTLQGEM